MSGQAQVDTKGDLPIEEQLEYTEKTLEGQHSQEHKQFISDAAEATQQQKGQGVRSALKMYRKAIIFSLIFSTAIIMEVRRFRG